MGEDKHVSLANFERNCSRKRARANNFNVCKVGSVRCSSVAAGEIVGISDSLQDDDQELEYGPGIVDKLRSRFLNLTLREREKARCGLKLRKFSSLESLHKEPVANNDFKPVSNNHATVTNNNNSNSNAIPKKPVNLVKPVVAVRKNPPVTSRPNFNRAQSMESLIALKSKIIPEKQVNGNCGNHQNALPFPVKYSSSMLINENVVIVEQSNESFSKNDGEQKENVSEQSLPNSPVPIEEIPRSDIVKRCKRIFEQSDNVANSKCNTYKFNRPVRGGKGQVQSFSKLKTKRNENCANRPLSNSAKEKEFNEVLKPVGRFTTRSCDTSLKKLDNVEPKENLHLKKTEHLSVQNHNSVATEKEFNLTTTSQERETSTKVQSIVNKREFKEKEHTPKVDTKNEGNVKGPIIENKNSISNSINGIAESQDVATESTNNVSAKKECDKQDSLESETDFVKQKVNSTNMPKNIWQKPQTSDTSIVFDFRGKDVKPNISVNPPPFGSRPLNHVYKNEKKLPGFHNHEDDSDDDQGSLLPEKCGVSFEGENVKIGKGALLTRKNKKLKIHFDDSATSTFEYPSEGSFLNDIESSVDAPISSVDDGKALDVGTIGNGSKSTLLRNTTTGNSGGLSNYMPQVLSSTESFRLGISPSVATKKPQVVENGNSSDKVNGEVLTPADPADIMSWSSSTVTSDLLF